MPERPNVLLVMTDQERYPPSYEDAATAVFRRSQLVAHERLRARSVEFHRHYCAATACSPSRVSLFTGQYPSLHGVTNTDGLAKSAADPGINWLDPDTVPTMGDWFRAAGYRAFYKGKWHLSHADLVAPGTHVGLMSNDDAGAIVPETVERYLRADRLDPFGFSEWIGREPHGPALADTGCVRDDLLAHQVCGLFGRLRASDDGSPWLAVASFVNPHDIAFSGVGQQLLGLPEPDETVPEIPAAPSQADPLDLRPTAQAEFRDLWPQLLYAQATDSGYRRFYYWLHKLVDRAIERILDALEGSGLADDTVVVLTSDHGEMLGAHGGQLQKWHNAYDEAIRVPLLVSGPGIEPRGDGVQIPTSHVDLLPTLLGLVGADPPVLADVVAERHIEVQPFVGRDLSALVTDGHDPAALDAPVYFMTEDQISKGLRVTNRFTGEPYEPVHAPANVESVIAVLPDDGHLWKLNRYYDRLGDATSSQWELHDLTADPEERHDLARAGHPNRPRLEQILAQEREHKRRVPQARNPDR
jgi:arylsulfatase A-like enzyme